MPNHPSDSNSNFIKVKVSFKTIPYIFSFLTFSHFLQSLASLIFFYWIPFVHKFLSHFHVNESARVCLFALDNKWLKMNIKGRFIGNKSNKEWNHNKMKNKYPTFSHHPSNSVNLKVKVFSTSHLISFTTHLISFTPPPSNDPLVEFISPSIHIYLNANKHALSKIK